MILNIANAIKLTQRAEAETLNISTAGHKEAIKHAWNLTQPGEFTQYFSPSALGIP